MARVVTVPAGSSVAAGRELERWRQREWIRCPAIKRDDQWWHQSTNSVVTATDDYLKEGSES